MVYWRSENKAVVMNDDVRNDFIYHPVSFAGNMYMPEAIPRASKQRKTCRVCICFADSQQSRVICKRNAGLNFQCFASASSIEEVVTFSCLGSNFGFLRLN